MFIHQYAHCNLCTCTKIYTGTLVWFTQFLPSVVASLVGQIYQSYRHSLIEITKLLGTSADSLMPTPSCFHAHYTIWNVTMTSLLYIQVLGVNIEALPQVIIKLDFLMGVKPQHKPTKPTTKPMKPQLHSKGSFHQTKSVMWCPRWFPHAQHLGHMRIPTQSYTNQHSLLAREVFSLHSIITWKYLCLPH